MTRAANARAWAIGIQRRNGFHVRKVVWGRLMARMEKRDGEHIRPVIIMLYDTGVSGFLLQRPRMLR